jgi:hypothetical protein
VAGKCRGHQWRAKHTWGSRLFELTVCGLSVHSQGLLRSMKMSPVSTVPVPRKGDAVVGMG